MYMTTPRTTKLTLKKIVENIDKIPANGFGDETPKLSRDQVKRLYEMTNQFETIGASLQNEENLLAAAKSLSELCQLAETYAVNECGDWFQQDIIKKDMNELKKRVGEFQKITKEAYARMQQLGVGYQDIRHILGRYFKLGQPTPDQGFTEPSSGKEAPNVD